MPQPKSNWPVLAVGLATALFLAGTQAHAQSADGTARRDLKRIESELEARRARAQELKQAEETLRLQLQKLRRQALAMTRETRTAERALAEAEQRLEALELEKSAQVRALRSRDQVLAVSLRSLSRLARRSPAMLLASGGSPIDTYRSVRMMGAVSGGLMLEAQRIKLEIATLGKLHDDIAEERQKYRRNADDLNETRVKLTRLVDEKLVLERDFATKYATEQQSVRRLSQEARDLRELLARLTEIEARRRRAAAERAEAQQRAERQAKLQVEREQRLAYAGPRTPPIPAHKPDPKAKAAAPETTPQTVKTVAIPPRQPFSQARGKLPMPAQGRVVKRFGSRNSLGQKTRGLLVETLPQAQVIAPFDGAIVYAGEFRDYGLLLIISLGEGYHILLSGMSRLYCVIGQQLLAGEPIGEMGGIDDERSKLYVELRRQGEPINPLPWIAAAKGKISG